MATRLETYLITESKMNTTVTIIAKSTPDDRVVCGACFYVRICKRTKNEICMAHNRADGRSVYFVELRN